MSDARQSSSSMQWDCWPLQSTPVRPWKNGGGETREIAISPPDATTETFDWRLSVAEISRSGEFSRFPGIERTLCFWHGNSVRLQISTPGADYCLINPGDVARFSGDSEVAASPIDGPVSCINIMRRSSALGHLDMTLERGAFSLASIDTRHQEYWLIAMQGDWQLATAKGTKSLPHAHIAHGHPELEPILIAPMDTCHSPLLLVIQCRTGDSHADRVSTGQ